MIGAKEGFLPINREDMNYLGWDEVDFVYVSGDAYVDHSSFAVAVISRVLTANGYRVGIIAQPDKDNIEAFRALGRPRLAFLVGAGNMDSMVNHYTAAKKPRSQDLFSPGGKTGLRPDRATIVYCNKIREAYGKIPIIIGGIEASLRRFAHYDYWQDSVRRSILFDSRADILSYGMGEKSIVAIADALSSGCEINDIKNIAGTCYITKDISNIEDKAVICPPFEEIKESKKSYAIATKLQFAEQDHINGKILIQKHQERFLVQNPPQKPLSTKELDFVYELPYVRKAHPIYDKDGGVPAYDEVKFSLISSRGCYGMCNFCSLNFHQGRFIQARSHESIINEARLLTKLPDFKGYIHDVGGPTANFRQLACGKQEKFGACKEKRCLYPHPCSQLEVDHSDYVSLLRKLRKLDGIKKVFVRSGIRYDYLIADKDETFFYELCKHHISGQLKVAPEHISQDVLKYMGKPGKKVYDKFSDKFYEINNKIGKEQYLVPYLMSSHPGSTLESAIELALYLKKHKLNPEQVQDFYPTPGTISTCMFYTGLDPQTLKEVYVPKSFEEKSMQRALLQCANPKNRDLIKKALIKTGRTDLIGYSPECLIKPEVEKNGRSKSIRREESISKNKGRVKGRSRRNERKGH